ncbi:hypothetical protein AJ79_09602 [Helicocarpus griseus UAMH5409]|uniref:F-box domain-containing protein n=1 Tax=Helicocarpus griseus UAMH5409 TaxID=1447875 RepID=A0A2B7WIS9_9EURO|nr:hypothetical protein AJ79_09602 [Helicocarpus griseus UAMH5409]
MASGIAHRRMKPAISKINAYPRRYYGSSWWDLYSTGEVEQQATVCRRNPQRAAKQPRGRNPFNLLPTEITLEVLFNLDFGSLGNIRCLNKHFKCAVKSLPPYRLLKEHASHTIKVIFEKGVSSSVTVRQLWTEFNRPSCRACGSFGPFIFLPTVQRCCEECLQDNNANLQMISLKAVSVSFAIPTRIIKQKLPVVYSPAGSVKQLEALAIQVYGSLSKLLEEVVRRKRMERISRYNHQLRKWSRSKTAFVRNTLKRRPSYRWSLVPLAPDLNSSDTEHWKCRGATDLPFWDYTIR